LDNIRSAYVYGTISVQTYQEILGIDPEQELERMRKEWSEGLRDLYYPHLISNQEDKGTDTEKIIPTTKKQIEKQVEKEKKPSTMNKAGQDGFEIAPYTKENHPKYLDKYPQEAINIWITVFNESLPKGEDYAFPAAWSVMKKFLRRHYKKDGDKWVKKGK
jgi:Tfp pilus assembly pilus retraction ATPase PilT